MLSALTIDDRNGIPVSLLSDTCGILNASGLIGVASLRTSYRVRPQADGGIDETKWEDGRLTSFAFEVSGTGSDWDARHASAYANFRAVTKPMQETMKFGPALMKWTESVTGLQLQRYVKLASQLDGPINDNAARLVLSAQFYSEDPRAYSQSEDTASTTITGGGGGFAAPVVLPILLNAAAGGTLAVDNQGTRSSPATFRIYGQCTDARILLVDTGEQIALTGTINLGDYVEIDVQRRTAYLNGLTSAFNMVNPVSTRWFELPEGTSTLRLLAASYDTSAALYVAFRAAY